ncbi:hypothetical protein LguiA_011590 [Lonicera macranthoides]
MNKELHILQPFTAYSVLAMSQSSFLISLLVIAARPQSPSLMKLKLGFKIPFTAVFPISLHSNNRLI